MALQEKDKIYIAGYLDADGSLMITKFGSTEQIVVQCASVHREFIEYLKSIYGGMYVYRDNYGKNSKKLYQWRVVARDAERVIIDVYPYLRLKKERARILISFQNTKGKGGTAVSEENKKLRINLISILRSLNRRGVTA